VPLTRRELLAASLASVAAACGRRAAPHRVTSPVGPELDACKGAPPAVLKLLTWNVFLMPAWIHESPHNARRAAAIGAVLAEQDADVVCLQKVFDSAARDTLARALGPAYPYRYGPLNDRRGPLISGGVWVLSRAPLTDYQEIEFDDCGGVECFSRKGALLLSGRCGTVPFRLVSTHLQGEAGPRFTDKNRRVRALQMKAIEAELLRPNLEPGVPFFLCGDFGTPRFTDDGGAETQAYRDMLALFGADNGPAPRVTLDESDGANTLARDITGRRNELDYILVRPNGARVAVTRHAPVFRRPGWDDRVPERTDLSYRYAVTARVELVSGA
jgi:endonuclease/exonuclease/phosphatase family metal-dependent hydrolase